MKKENELISNVVEITPKIASLWLQKNVSANRRLNQVNIEHLKRQMITGNWLLNGEAIQFDNAGSLVNGQHRLTAVVESGVMIKSLVVFGVDAESFKTFDTGKTRNAATAIEFMGGKSHCTLKASSIANYWKYMRAEMKNGSLNMSERPSPMEISEIYSQNMGIVDEACKTAGRVRNFLRLNPGVVCGAYLVFARKGYLSEASEFYSKIALNLYTSTKDPANVLVKKMIKDNPPGRGSISPQQQMAMLFKAFDNHIRDRELSTMVLFIDGKDKFPFLKEKNETKLSVSLVKLHKQYEEIVRLKKSLSLEDSTEDRAYCDKEISRLLTEIAENTKIIFDSGMW